MISEIIHSGQLLSKAKKALILLHGRGGSAKNMLGLADLLCDDQFYIAAPQATNNTWYPYSFMEEERLNEPKLSQSIKGVQDLIVTISQSIPHNNIYLAGFSQGACLALEVSARQAIHYAAVVAFTGGLIGQQIDERKYQGNFEGAQVFISNGDQDSHIPLHRSKESKEVMEKLGAIVTLKIYPGREHTITREEIEFVKNNLF